MFIASSSEAPGAEPGLQSVATAIGTPWRAERVDRRQLRLGEHVERDRQQHRDGAGPRECRGVVLGRVLEVIAGERAVPRGHLAAADVRQLLGVQAHRQAERPRGREQPVALRGGERDVLAVRIDRVDQPLRSRSDAAASRRRPGRRSRPRGPRTRAAARAPRAGWSTTVTGCSVARARGPRAACVASRLEVEAVARLDLDRRHAFLQQRRAAAARLCSQQLVVARGARRAHRAQDAAALARDVGVARAGRAARELRGALAGEHEVRVAVDRVPASASGRRVRSCGRAAAPAGRSALVADPLDRARRA